MVFAPALVIEGERMQSVKTAASAADAAGRASG
jgi:hypothetical protein